MRDYGELRTDGRATSPCLVQGSLLMSMPPGIPASVSACWLAVGIAVSALPACKTLRLLTLDIFDRPRARHRHALCSCHIRSLAERDHKHYAAMRRDR